MNPLNLFRKTRNTALDVQEGAWLTEQTRKYPYFSLLHMVAAKNAQQKKNSDAETLRTIAALYAQDRKRFAGYIEERYNFSFTSIEALFAQDAKTTTRPAAKPEEPKNTETKTETKAETKPAPKPEAKTPAPEAPKTIPAPAPTAAAKPATAIPKPELVKPIPAPAASAVKAQPAVGAVGPIDLGLQTRISIRSSMLQGLSTSIAAELKAGKAAQPAAMRTIDVATAATPTPTPTAAATPAPTPTVISMAKPATVDVQPKAVPSMAKPADAKAPEPKPVDVKPATTPKAEATPATPKPAEAKTPEPKPVDVKPATTPKAEATPATPKPAEADKPAPLEVKPKAAAAPIEFKRTEPAKTAAEAPQPSTVPAVAAAKSELAAKTEPPVEADKKVLLTEEKKPTPQPTGRTVYTREDKPEAAREQAAGSSAEPATKAGSGRAMGARPGTPLNPMNAPESDNADASFESLRRSLLQLIQSQIAGEQSAKGSVKTSTIVPDPALKASTTAPDKEKPAKPLSAEPDPTQQELIQLDSLRNKLQGLPPTPEPKTVTPAKDLPKATEVKAAEIKKEAKAAPVVEVQPVRKAAKDDAKKDRSGPLEGANNMARFVPLDAEPAKAKADDKLTTPSMQRFVQPAEGAEAAKPAAKTEQGEPRIMMGKRIVAKSEPVGQESKNKLEAAPKPAPDAKPAKSGSESMQRFVEPQFETPAPTMHVQVSPEAPAKPAKTEAPATTEVKEAPAVTAKETAAKAPAKTEEFSGANSMRRFKDLTFDAPATNIAADKTKPTIEVVQQVYQEALAKSIKQTEEPSPDSPTAQLGENSMTRFVQPEFYEKPATLHLPREPKAKQQAEAPATSKAEVPSPQKPPVAKQEAEPKPAPKAPATEDSGANSMRRFVDLTATQQSVMQDRTQTPAAESTPKPAAKPEPPAAPKAPATATQTAPVEPRITSPTFNRFVQPEFAATVRLSTEGARPEAAPAPKAEAKAEIKQEIKVAAKSEIAAALKAEPSVAPKAEQPVTPTTSPNSFDYQHRNIEVEIVLKPDQLKYFKEDPSKLHAKAAIEQAPDEAKPTEKAAPATGTTTDEALKGFLEQEAFLKVERAFEKSLEEAPAPKPQRKVPDPEIDSSLPEQLEEIQQTGAMGGSFNPPIATPLEGTALPLQPGEFAERMNTFRENLQRIRAKSLPASPEVNLKKIQRKFLDRVVQSMSSSAPVSIDAVGGEQPVAAPAVAGAPMDETTLLAQVPAPAVSGPKSNIDTLIDRFGRLENVISTNLAAARSELQSVPTPAAPSAVQATPAKGDDEVSETQAQVYILQGQPFKALAIYEKLSLKFPEKSGYFASLIQNLEI